MRLRAKVLAVIGGFDLKTPQGRKQGYDKVIEVFVGEYTEKVLATPRSSFPWLLPSLAAVGALGLLIVVGRRWMRGSSGVSPGAPGTTASTASPTADDDKYLDKLEDELAETD